MDLINDALVLGLKRLAQSDGSPQPDELLTVLEQVRESQTSADLLALADLFNEISALGEAERKACLQILKVFADYRRSTQRTWS